MAVYLTESGEPGACMRVVRWEQDSDEGPTCSKRATRRCLDLELCDEHAAEWLAYNRRPPADARVGIDTFPPDEKLVGVLIDRLIPGEGPTS